MKIMKVELMAPLPARLVVSVPDGDTIEVRPECLPLSGIDRPEEGQRKQATNQVRD
jgi:endonuclease YncB( thermonuclease family)